MDFNLEKFNELKNFTELEYKKIISVYSPALQTEIIFNADGWHHLRYDSTRSERNKKVQQGKFIHLSKAVEILKISTTIQEYRRQICAIGKPDKSGFHKTSTIEYFGFIAIINLIKQMRIKIIVRKIGNGQYHFWSVIPFWTLTNYQTRIIGSKKIEDE